MSQQDFYDILTGDRFEHYQIDILDSFVQWLQEGGYGKKTRAIYESLTLTNITFKQFLKDEILDEEFEHFMDNLSEHMGGQYDDGDLYNFIYLTLPL